MIVLKKQNETPFFEFYAVCKKLMKIIEKLQFPEFMGRKLACKLQKDLRISKDLWQIADFLHIGPYQTSCLKN